MNIRFRPRREPEPEYVVAWNGTMAGAGTRVETVPPTPRTGEHVFSRYDVLAVLRGGGADGLTMREIADALETTVHRVNSLLSSLMKDGHVASDETATRKRYGGQLRRYRVVSSPILDVGRARGAHASVDVTPSTTAEGTKGERGTRADRSLRRFPSAL